MKVINNKQFEELLKNISTELKAILLYGQDYGLIHEKLDKLKSVIIKDKTDQTFAIKKFFYSEIKDKIWLLAEEINNLSFFITKKLIIIDEMNLSIDEKFKNIIKSVPIDTILILLANDLPPSSSLRKFFESEKNLVSVASYKDEFQDLVILASNFLKSNNFSFEKEFIENFCRNFQGNRLSFYSELNKIILLNEKNNKIKESELESSLDLEDLESFWLNLLTDRKFSEGSLKKIFSEYNIVAVIRGFNNFLLRLSELSEIYQKTKNFRESCQLISPSIFFKKIPKYQNIISRSCDISYIQKIISDLRDLEIKAKITGNVSEALFVKLLEKILV